MVSGVTVSPDPSGAFSVPADTGGLEASLTSHLKQDVEPLSRLLLICGGPLFCCFFLISARDLAGTSTSQSWILE